VTFVPLVALSALFRWVTFVRIVGLSPLALTLFQAYPHTSKGSFVAKRLTPIERAIAGEPQSRQARYYQRLRRRGVVRLSLFVPEARADELRDLARSWVAEHLRDDD
jgi:hypothetical protein